MQLPVILIWRDYSGTEKHSVYIKISFLYNITGRTDTGIIPQPYKVPDAKII